jgi:hypothetical protein
VAQVIASYRPRATPEAAGVFARAAVAAADPPSAARAKALLWAGAKLGAFGISVGLAAEPAVLLCPSVIERFVLVGCAEVSGAARRTLRTNLRHLSARVGPGGPPPVALSRERAKAPYTETEMAAWLALADTQPSIARRVRAQGLICLGAGAGLLGADLRRVRGADVVCRSGGMVVAVGGRRARVVPVLARYHQRLSDSASFAGAGWIIGGVDPDRHDVTTPLISSLAGGADLGRLNTARLRATWLMSVADHLGIKAFMDAAGITCSQRLGDVIGALASPTEPEAIALLGGPR